LRACASIGAVDVLALVIAIIGLVLSAISATYTALAYIRDGRLLKQAQRSRVSDLLLAFRSHETAVGSGRRLLQDWREAHEQEITRPEQVVALRLGRRLLIIASCVLIFATALYIWLARPF
jgi:hypothetical protein